MDQSVKDIRPSTKKVKKKGLGLLKNAVVLGLGFDAAHLNTRLYPRL